MVPLLDSREIMSVTEICQFNVIIDFIYLEMQTKSVLLRCTYSIATAYQMKTAVDYINMQD